MVENGKFHLWIESFENYYKLNVRTLLALERAIVVQVYFYSPLILLLIAKKVYFVCMPYYKCNVPFSVHCCKLEIDRQIAVNVFGFYPLKSRFLTNVHTGWSSKKKSPLSLKIDGLQQPQRSWRSNFCLLILSIKNINFNAINIHGLTLLNFELL